MPKTNNLNYAPQGFTPRQNTKTKTNKTAVSRPVEIAPTAPLEPVPLNDLANAFFESGSDSLNELKHQWDSLEAGKLTFHSCPPIRLSDFNRQEDYDDFQAGYADWD